MKRLLGSLLALLLLSAPAFAQNSKASMISEINTNFPDNTTGLITPALLRTTTTDMVNSYFNFPGINAQTGVTYTVVAADNGKLITFNNSGAVAVTVPVASTSGFNPFSISVLNLGAGTVTLTPTTSTINGVASLSVPTGTSATIYSDGTNYFAINLSGTVTVGTGTANRLAYYNATNTMTSSPFIFTSGPTLSGGSAASSALTLQSTTGVGTSDKIVFNTGSQVQAAQINTAGLVSIGTTVTSDTNGNIRLNVQGSTNTDVIEATDGTVQFGVFLAGSIGALLGTVTNHTLGFFTNDGSSLLNINTSGTTDIQVLKGEADLRFFGTLSCNPAAPSSTNVANAGVSAYNAGYRRFFIPAGCFVNVTNSTWTSTFGTRTIPSGTYWRGEDNQTSGFSVCSTFSGCTPTAGTTVTISGVTMENVFTMDGGCYNVDSAAFGHPAFCPLWKNFTNIGFTGTGMNPYPNIGLTISVGPTSNGTWNGTDTPAMAVNNETRGDNLFVQSLSAAFAGTANFLNFFGDAGGGCSSQQVGSWTNDGRAKFGSASCTAHAGAGTITLVDSSASCAIYPNVGGISQSCSSDERLKSDITDASDELAWLASFRIRDFTVKADGERRTGIVAQELRENHPEMVRDGEDGYLHTFEPPQWKMMKAMQQMQGEIEELKRRLN